MQTIGIGLAGLGNVGAGVFKHLTQNRALLRERLGYELAVRKIAVRDLTKDRGVDGAGGAAHDRCAGRCSTIPTIQIVVELMGQKEESLRLMLGAIERKKIVVTGNKALLAEHGKEIFEAATRTRCRCFSRRRWRAAFRSSRRSARRSSANHIQSIHGIINGTSNYILTRMTEAGMGFAEALAEAQAAGYAEADPTLDVNGGDAAHKAIILASLAYGFWVPTDKIFVEGIEQLTASDICFARAARLPHQAARHHQGRHRRRDRGARASDARSRRRTCSRA